MGLHETIEGKLAENVLKSLKESVITLDYKIENSDEGTEKMKQDTQTFKQAKILQTHYNKGLEKMVYSEINNACDYISQQTTQSNQIQKTNSVGFIRPVSLAEAANPISIEHIKREALEKTIKQYDIDTYDTKALVEEGTKLTEKHPDITEENLAIKLLEKIASSNRNKKLGKLAKEMLEEKWWEK